MRCSTVLRCAQGTDGAAGWAEEQVSGFDLPLLTRAGVSY